MRWIYHIISLVYGTHLYKRACNGARNGLLTATGQTDVYHEADNGANQSITRLTHASPWSKENLSYVRRQGPNMSRGDPRSLCRYTQARNTSCSFFVIVDPCP